MVIGDGPGVIGKEPYITKGECNLCLRILYRSANDPALGHRLEGDQKKKGNPEHLHSDEKVGKYSLKY